MKPPQIYQHLLDLAEKLGISVTEENLKITGLPVKSGFCVVKDKKRIIIDKHKPLEHKIDVLIEYLRGFPTETVFVVPAIRDLLQGISKAKDSEAKDTINKRTK